MTSKLTKIIALSGALLSANPVLADINEYLVPETAPGNVHTEINQNTDFYLHGSQEISFNELIKAAKGERELFRVLLPGKLGNIYPERVKESFFEDVTEILNNLESVKNNPANSNIISPHIEDIPFDKLKQAIRDEDFLSARFYGQQVATHLEILLNKIQDSNILQQIEDAVLIKSRTLEELKKIKECLVDDNIWDDDGWNTELYGKASTSIDTSMTFEDERGNIGKIEQYNGIDGKGFGFGGVVYDLSDIKHFNLFGEINLRAYYELNREWQQINATQLSINGSGIGFIERYFQKGKTLRDYKLSASLEQGINLITEESKIETEGKSLLSHLFYNKKGRTSLFLDFGLEETEQIITDILTDKKYSTYESRILKNVLISHEDGEFTPFVSLRDGEITLGTFVNSRYLTGRIDENENIEFYVKLNTGDGNKVQRFMQEMERIKHNHHPGTESKIKRLREQMNRELSGILFRYSHNLNEEEYSVLIGKGKFTLEVGQSIDDWVTTNFASLNLFGINFIGEIGKDTKYDLTTRKYLLQLPTLRAKNFGTMFFEVEYEPKERHPNMNYRIGITKTF